VQFIPHKNTKNLYKYQPFTAYSESHIDTTQGGFNITQMARVVNPVITFFKCELLCNNSALVKPVFITLVPARPNTHIQVLISKDNHVPWEADKQSDYCQVHLRHDNTHDAVMRLRMAES
jgi:hypothetical protein